MRNPYIQAIERRMNALRAEKTEIFCDPASGRTETIQKGEWIGSAYELRLFNDLLKEFRRIDRKFSVPVVSKLLKVADQCESGGHKSRARMFRALAKEFEVNL